MTEIRKAPKPCEVFRNSGGNVSITLLSGSLQNFSSKDDIEDLSVLITMSNILAK